jgi:hypothetical protein
MADIGNTSKTCVSLVADQTEKRVPYITVLEGEYKITSTVDATAIAKRFIGVLEEYNWVPIQHVTPERNIYVIWIGTPAWLRNDRSGYFDAFSHNFLKNYVWRDLYCRWNKKRQL